MAEYWKSQPKKFCDFCKCWITDNKASVDFHERGKKHQENVKIKIQEVKKKGAERRQEQEQLHDDLAAIEAAALKAYKKDIGHSNYSEAKDTKSETKFKQAEEKKTEESCCIETDNSSSSGEWAAYQTQEGYWYYFNNQTGESRWDPPGGFSFSNQHENQQTSGEASSSEQISEVVRNERINEAIRNDEVDDQSKEENNEHNSPFGKWETVAVYESNADSTTKQEAVDKEKNVMKQVEVPAAKFKEKQLPVRTQNNLNETNVAFKKRKSNQEKKRSIRQRIDDS